VETYLNHEQNKTKKWNSEKGIETAGMKKLQEQSLT
jgi:hypothetical protein